MLPKIHLDTQTQIIKNSNRGGLHTKFLKSIYNSPYISKITHVMHTYKKTQDIVDKLRFT